MLALFSIIMEMKRVIFDYPQNLEEHFRQFRDNVVGNDLKHSINGKEVKIIYADWTASGRLYRPLESFISETLGSYCANTHTETTLTGKTMTHAYHEAQDIIKKHCNANDSDVLIAAGSGMTTVINKFQRILGLRFHDRFRRLINASGFMKPLVIITHMEHHSNHTTWEECFCDIEIIKVNQFGLPCLEHLEEILNSNSNRTMIIGSFSACSNVTGIHLPVNDMVELVHRYGGYCFIDYCASAPYVKIDMHPEGHPERSLDAVFFSPHKFLGGPGSSGVLIFNKDLYDCKVPDQPGGGTVIWTNPWHQHRFIEDIEAREDGGTPAIFQTIKAALAMMLKDKMGIENIINREKELTDLFLGSLKDVSQLILLEGRNLDRVCIFSFYVRGTHHNLIVRILNDIYGIQTRGGCACAGTYIHNMLGLNKDISKEITDGIDRGDLTKKPGVIRVSLHPIMTNDEVLYIADSMREAINKAKHYEEIYSFEKCSGEWFAKNEEVKYISLKDFDP
jgi:selenocysteine lyase/cysteine desulfurase